MYWDEHREQFPAGMRAHAHQHDRRNTHIPPPHQLQAAEGVSDGFIYSMRTESTVSTVHPAQAEQVFSDPSTPADYRESSSQFQALIELPPEQLEAILLGGDQAAADATFNTLEHRVISRLQINFRNQALAKSTL